MKPIYVETKINAPIETVWTYTQDPKLHEQWDLRFTSITYNEKLKEEDPQTFTYTTKVMPGITVSGWGESKGTHEKATGEKTSSLHFGTNHQLSPIVEGKGYWHYKPSHQETIFLTQYDYKARFGKNVDRIFRPVIGWATALSFNVLARWIEKGEQPRTQYKRFFSYYAIISLFIVVWLYHGLVPKVFGKHPLEIEMLQSVLPFTLSNGELVIVVIGLLEASYALLFFVRKLHPYLLMAQAILFPFLTVSAVLTGPETVVAPFNVITLNLCLIVCSIIALLLRTELPTASTCVRKRR
jgi:hypothetical protein